jgi:hypothetical protein
MKTTQKRTQLYLPADLYEQALRYARKRGLSLAAVVRLSLRESLGRRERLSKHSYETDPVWKLVGRVDSGQGDLADAHDHYLYGRPKTRR